MKTPILDTLLGSRQFLSFAGFFFLILFFFITHYKYYPGLSLSFDGEVDGQINGKVYWDFGQGFNEFDSIDVRLSAGFDDADEDLGAVTVEAIGMKSERAKGYGVWLVVDSDIYENNRFVVEGQHEWGDVVASGRQLKLGAGTKIIFPGQKKIYSLNIIENPLAGFAKVSSEKGMVAYYDCYGNNRFNRIVSHYFGQKSNGEIALAIDPYRLKMAKFLSLPQQKISALKFHPQYTDSIKEIVPANALTIQSMSLAHKTSPIIVEKLIVNGRVIDWQDSRIVSSGVAAAKGRMLDPHNSIAFQGTVFSLEVVLSGDSDPSALKFLLDGKEIGITRAVNNGKAHILEVNCPIISSSLALSSIQLIDHSGAILKYPVNPALSSDVLISLLDVAEIKQDAFHWALLSVQTITAAMIALLIYWSSKLAIWREGNSLKELVNSLFYRHKRWFFWGIFIVGLGVNFAFLLADWPGSMTPDSIEMNREVKWLRFANHHPYIYGIIVLGLYNLFDSPLTVILFQTICFHLLAGLFFYLLFREGVRLVILIPLFCLSLFSVPINLFNITMWKDIPFSTLVLFWAFFLTWMLYKKLYQRDKASLSTRDAIFLSVLFFLVCTLRFNGLMFIPVIPVLLCYFYWQKKRELLTFLVCSAILLTSYYSLAPLVTFHKPGHSDFAKHILEKRSVKMAAVLDVPGNYFLEDYLSERLKIFLASIGTSSKADTWYNDTHYTPQEWYSVGEMRSDMSSRPQSHSLALLLAKILKATTPYKGFFSGRFIFFNGLFALCAMTAVFLLYRWLPLSAFYSGFFLYQAVGMFFVVWPRWRYLYFVYLGGIFLLPIVILEVRQLLLKKGNCRKLPEYSGEAGMVSQFPITNARNNE